MRCMSRQKKNYLPTLANHQDYHFQYKSPLNYRMDHTDILRCPDQRQARIQILANVLNLTGKQKKKKNVENVKNIVTQHLIHIDIKLFFYKNLHI